MKNLIITLSLLMFISYGFTQKTELSWGDPIKTKNRTDKYMPDIIGNIDNDLIGYIVKPERGNDEFWMTTFDISNMNLKDQVLLFGGKSEKSEYKEVMLRSFIWYGRVCFITRAWDRDVIKFFARTYDSYGKEINKNELISVNRGKGINLDNSYIKFCPDSSKIAIVIAVADQATRKYEYLIKVYDKEFNPLIDKKMKLPYDEKKCATISVKFQSDGNLYIVVQYSKDNVPKGAPKYAYRLYTYPTDGSEDINDYDFDLKTKFVSDFEYTIDKNGNIVYAGFYSEKNPNSSDGFFFYTFTKGEKKPATKDLKAFDFDFRKKFMKSRKAEKGEEVPSLSIRDYVKREDGGLMLVCESRYSITRCTSNSSGGSSCTTTFYYNDIVIININPEGNLSWYNFINKAQESSTFVSNTFDLMVTNNKIYFIYPERKDMFDKGVDDNLKYTTLSYKKGINAVVVVYDINGNSNKDVLFDCDKGRIALFTNDYFVLNDNQMIIIGKDDDYFRLGKVTF